MIRIYEFDFKWSSFERIFGSHDKTVRIWDFDANFIENNTDKLIKSENENDEEKKIATERLISKHHKTPLTALKYDGVKHVISSDVSG